MKVLTFFSNNFILILDLTLFDKVNLIIIQTMVTVILEGNKLRTHGGAFLEVVRYNSEGRGLDSRRII